MDVLKGQGVAERGSRMWLKSKNVRVCEDVFCESDGGVEIMRCEDVRV